MKRFLTVLLVLILGGVIALPVVRNLKLQSLEKIIFQLVPEKQLPTDSLPSQRITIDLMDHVMQANWVSAGKTAPSFFILHGNGETLSDWRPLQAYLYKKGYSSFVFDYSGFGSSTGKPTFEGLEKDAKEVYRTFSTLVPDAKERIVFCHSLGSNIALEVANNFKPIPDKLIIHGAFTSGRDILVQKKMVNNFTKWFLPDVYDGLEKVRTMQMPLYILHSQNDSIIPFYMGEELAKKAGDKAKFLPLNTPGHNAVYELPNDSTWLPILNFINQ